MPDGPAVFVRVPAPHRDELAQIVVRIRVRVLRLLRRAGLDPDQLDEQDVQGDLLSGWQAASLQGRVSVGPRAGWPVIRIGAQNVAVPPMGQGLCADAEGYNLHAGVHVPAGQRDRLEHLLRYMLRPPFARDRLERLGDGRVLVREGVDRVQHPAWIGGQGRMLGSREMLHLVNTFPISLTKSHPTK